MKYFRMGYDEIVFRRSYINLILLNASIPGHKPFDKDGRETRPSRKRPKGMGRPRELHANDFLQRFM